jgi:N-acetylglutamate synthase-like GNAT family acetyltransferase
MQWHGVGGALLEHLTRRIDRPMLVGTWAAAEWAISFYRRHGFEQVSPERRTELLRAYWTIPDRQIETSVVLVRGMRDTESDLAGERRQDAGLHRGLQPS